MTTEFSWISYLIRDHFIEPRVCLRHSTALTLMGYSKDFDMYGNMLFTSLTPEITGCVAVRLIDGLGLNFKDERMETKHTPGPWVLHPAALHPAVRSVGTAETGPRRICTVGTMNGNPVDKANARLIAAAPELLEAAIELKDVCNRPSAARTRAEAWRKLDKAIAKALQPNF